MVDPATARRSLPVDQATKPQEPLGPRCLIRTLAIDSVQVVYRPLVPLLSAPCILAHLLVLVIVNHEHRLDELPPDRKQLLVETRTTTRTTRS